MSISTKNDFIQIVTKQVRFPFDRKIIAIELEDHIQELESYFFEEAHDPLLAHERAIQEMGDPIFIGTELNRVHKPFWGWLWLATKSACIVLSCVVLVMSGQKIVNAYQASLRYKVPTETPADLFEKLNLDIGSLNVKMDQTPQLIVKINGDTLIFDRILLSKDGLLVILYQDVKSFDSWINGSDHYPLQALSTLILPDGQALHFKQDGVSVYQHHHVLIAQLSSPDITSFDLRYDGYSNHFSLHFNWGN